MTPTAAANSISTSVRLRKRVHAMVKEYSEITGVPMSRVLNSALEHWMSTMGLAHIEGLKHLQTRSKNANLSVPNTDESHSPCGKLS